jgi:PAS domain S-box-containing protein
VATVDAQAPKAARAIAVAERGEPRPVFVYSLEGTPCQKVFDGAMCVHPARVQSLFPSDALLAEMGAEAYAGCPLTDTDGRTIGLLAVIDQAPFDNPEGVEFVVRLFAERAATELVRARTAEALGASERRFRRLFEGSADAQLLLDEREVMDCNRAALDLFGSRRRDRVVGRTMGQISPEQQPNGQSSERAGRGMIAEAMVNGSARFEWVYRRGDGSTFHAEVVLTAYVLDGRRLVLAVVRDVSLRKRIEDELRRSQERLDLAVRGGQLGLWDWSYPTGEFTVNEQAWRMLGYEPREFPSTLEDWAGLVHPDDRGLLSSAIAAQIEGTSALAEAEYRMRSKEGQWVWVQFRGQVVERDQAGEPLRIAGTRFDITARKRAEAEAQRYLRQLRATSDRILAAQEEERRRIASGLHDSVCQTLVGAGLELAALQMGVADEALRSSLGDLTRLVNHAADEVRSLTFEISPPLLYDVGLAAALEWFAARLEAQHDLTFELDTGPEELVLDVADRVFLFHGARELMLNVVEHARARVATVKLRSSEQQVRLTVSDDGIGFDPAMVGPDMASRDNFGLFNVRERLRSRGGRLLIESALGKGSRVVLMLPLTRDA